MEIERDALLYASRRELERVHNRCKNAVCEEHFEFYMEKLDRHWEDYLERLERLCFEHDSVDLLPGGVLDGDDLGESVEIPLENGSKLIVSGGCGDEEFVGFDYSLFWEEKQIEGEIQ